VIEVKDLTVRYGGVTSLDGMTLTFSDGVCGLIGPNGAGKTTFFNVLSGFVRPAAGTVTAFDENLLRMTHFRRARWGVRRTFQTEQAISDLTVYDNVAMIHSRLRGAARRGNRARVRDRPARDGPFPPRPLGGAPDVPDRTGHRGPVRVRQRGDGARALRARRRLPAW